MTGRIQIRAESVVAGITCGCWAVQTRPNRNSVVRRSTPTPSTRLRIQEPTSADETAL